MSDKIDVLIKSSNEAASTARVGWLTFVGLVGYLLITLSTVTHKELLLNSALKLPIIDAKIRLVGFYLYAPLLLIVVHTWIVLLHLFLIRKVWLLQDLLENAEDSNDRRLQLQSYVMLQWIAGPDRSRVVTCVLWLVVWVSLVVLPVVTFLYFQVSFLPYHDHFMVWWHRAFLLLDISMLISVGIFLGARSTTWTEALLENFRQHKPRLLGASGSVIAVLLFSILYATHPDEIASSLHDGLPLSSKLFGDKVDLVTRRHDGLFARNIILPNTDLVNDGAVANKSKGVRLSLRGRDLRNAVFSGSNLAGADFTGSDLSDADLSSADLREAQFACVETQYSFMDPIRQVRINSDDKTGCSKLRNTKFVKANLNLAVFRAAEVQGANFFDSDLIGADFSYAQLDGANMSGATLIGADLNGASLVGTQLSGAELQGAKFSQGFKLVATGRSSTKTDYFADADFYAADVSEAKFWGSAPPYSIMTFHKARFNDAKILRPSSYLRDRIQTSLAAISDSDRKRTIQENLKKVGIVPSDQPFKWKDEKRWRSVIGRSEILEDLIWIERPHALAHQFCGDKDGKVARALVKQFDNDHFARAVLSIDCHGIVHASEDAIGKACKRLENAGEQPENDGLVKPRQCLR